MKATSGKRKAASVLLAAALCLGTAAPAWAVVESVGGGSWDHDSSLTGTHSYYTHPTKKHSSAVLGGDHIERRSGTVKAGRTSRADDSHKPWVHPSVYWNIDE